MAIWLHVFAKNGLSEPNDDILAKLGEVEIEPLTILDSIKEQTQNAPSIKEFYESQRSLIESVFIEKPEEAYREYLVMLNYPYIEKDKLIDHWIADGLEREKREHQRFSDIYEAHLQGKRLVTWKKAKNNDYYFDLRNRNVGWGDIHITCVNDLIRMVGPGCIFGHYEAFQNDLPKRFKKYYHHVFKEIARIFNSDFLLYTHEWAGLEDEEDPDFNLEKLKVQSGWEKNSSDTLNNMTGFYLEKIED